MGSGHGHEMTATGDHRKRLIIVLVITCGCSSLRWSAVSLPARLPCSPTPAIC